MTVMRKARCLFFTVSVCLFFFLQQFLLHSFIYISILLTFFFISKQIDTFRDTNAPAMQYKDIYGGVFLTSVMSQM